MLMKRRPWTQVFWNTDGGGTGADEAGESTQGEDDSSKAGAKFSDQDMATARRSWERESEKSVQRAVNKALGGVFERFDVESAEELEELVTGKKGEKTTIEEKDAAIRKLTRKHESASAALAEAQKTIADLNSATQQRALKDQVVAAAGKINAFAENVYSIMVMDGRIGLDEDGQPVVKVQGTGDIAHGVTIERAVTEFVGANKHLQRASPGQGSGGSGGSGSPGEGSNGTPDLLKRSGQVSAIAQQLKEKGYDL